MSKLNRELMEKWVAALRSGNYNQGTEALYCYDEDAVENGRINPESYCCLGVLQDIKPGIEKIEDDEFLDEDSLKKFLGINAQDGFFQKTYAGWNDEGMPFPEIADELETQWLKNEEDNT